MIISIVALVIPLSSPGPVHAALTSHATISINDNSGFTIPDPVNGGGSGTLGDPFIIENWSISAKDNIGIKVRNTTAYFIIRNCYVHDGKGKYKDGIYFENVRNGKIDGAKSENNYNGINIYSSSNIIIENSTTLNNLIGTGINIYSSSNIIIENSTTLSNQYGISFSDSSGNVVENCTVSNNSSQGILLSNSPGNTIANSTIENDSVGIWFTSNSENNLIENNIVENNGGSGIYLDSSNNNRVDNNTCENNNYGIYLLYSDNNLIFYNTCENNLFGIFLDVSNNNNHIYHNNLINNENQAYDNSTNFWDNGYPSGGNYWSDYTGVDNYRGENQNISGSDNFGDTPYNIPGGSNRDRYPLMNPWSPLWSPPAIPPCTGSATINLENLYKVSLVKNLQLNTGSKLVVKFYDYGNYFENEVVTESITPPQSVVENENVPHPPQGTLPVRTAVKKAELVLTGDNTDNVISIIASFTVSQSDLRSRYIAILRAWSGHPEQQSAFQSEIKDILKQWSSAPP
jgi:parallel beta-helix repeat protein